MEQCGRGGARGKGQRKRDTRPDGAAATRPAPGNVKIQAPTMLPATPQRTADSRLVAPTPMIDDVIVCVVEIGAPNVMPATYRMDAAVVSAAKPCGGSRWMIRRPRVRMIRQPPE